MGLQDRDYAHRSEPGFHMGDGFSLTTRIVLINVAVYLVQWLIGGPRFEDWFILHGDFFNRPWTAYQLLTYGFLHDPGDIRHILFNMFGLWMFGRAIEARYGPKEFLAIYLSAIVLAGIGWVLSEVMFGSNLAQVRCLGASGGVTTIIVLFSLLYPRQIVYIWGVLACPMWVLALLLVGADVFRAIDDAAGSGEFAGNVGYAAHLSGALFAFCYWKSGIRITRWLPGGMPVPNFKRGPKLRVHTPEANDDGGDDRFSEEVDRILAKIREHGQDSLTSKERKTLQKASQEYKKRRQ